MSFMAKLIRQAAAGELNDDTKLYPSRKFTPQDIRMIAERGATEFRANDMNLISCFGPLEGDFGLYATLSNFVQTKGALTDEIAEAIQDGDEIALTHAFTRAMEYAFITLYEKNALARLQLVENLPSEAMAEYVRMKRSIGAAIAPSTAPAAAQEHVAPPAPVDPVEVCARDWKELGSTAFKKKYMNDTRMRPYFDAAQERGLI